MNLYYLLPAPVLHNLRNLLTSSKVKSHFKVVDGKLEEDGKTIHVSPDQLRDLISALGTLQLHVETPRPEPVPVTPVRTYPWVHPSTPTPWPAPWPNPGPGTVPDPYTYPRGIWCSAAKKEM